MPKSNYFWLNQSHIHSGNSHVAIHCPKTLFCISFPQIYRYWFIPMKTILYLPVNRYIWSISYFTSTRMRRWIKYFYDVFHFSFLCLHDVIFIFQLFAPKFIFSKSRQKNDITLLLIPSKKNTFYIEFYDLTCQSCHHI